MIEPRAKDAHPASSREKSDREVIPASISNRDPILGIVAAFLLFALIPLAFAAYTGNTWEDYYITFRASKNLAIGNGLVFTPGEHIHTFTSPLGVLAPALCSLIAGPDHDVRALWLFRLMSALILGGAGALFYTSLRRNLVSTIPLWTCLILLAEDPKTVMYSSNGMETAFTLFFLGLFFYALTVPNKFPTILLGLSLGGVMWSRPDGFMYAGAVALAVLVFRAGTAATLTPMLILRRFLLAGMLAAIIYLPWFLWAWWYYGSPIPHTILAKGLSQQHHYLLRLYHDLRETVLGGIFMPAYYSMGGWNPFLNRDGWNPLFYVWGAGLELMALLSLVLPGTSRFARALSATLLFSLVYESCIIPTPYPWYVPNCTWAGYLAIGLLFDHFRGQPAFRSITVQGAIAAALVLAQTVVLLCVFQQMHDQQAIIETGQRKQIGLWLKANAKTPHDTVFLECLGYIGYYSNLKMYDFPGLSSNEVIQARTKLKTDDWNLLIQDLRPDWVVLRSSEVYKLTKENPTLLSVDYQARQTFDSSAKVSALSIQGVGYLKFDQTFTVFQRSP